MTPHISAKKGEIASIVLMPGDPLRAKWIAEKYLTNPRLVNEVRNMFAYTGTFEGTEVTVMGHGMGIPSIGIYSHELFSFYDVKTIIRVGSAGSYRASLKLGDVFIARDSYSDSSYARLVKIEAPDKVLPASPALVQLAEEVAKEDGLPYHIGRVNAEDAFYNAFTLEENIARTGADAVEMEAFGLYANALRANRQALCLLTISDSLVTHESMSPHDRQFSFTKMIELALKIVKRLP